MVGGGSQNGELLISSNIKCGNEGEIKCTYNIKMMHLNVSF
jgi:hypothetical protein